MTGIPLLGIAIPAYKREYLLGRLLDSIKTNYPIVVSDNGGHLPPSFKDRYSRVRFLAGPEVPTLENWNRAARALETQWIIMPGDDDLYYPESFTIIEQTLLSVPTADIVFFGHHIIDEEDNVKSDWIPEQMHLKAPDGFDKVRRGTPARPPGIAFKAELFRRLGGFCEDFKITAGDNDFYQRAALVGESVFVNAVVTGYRVWTFGSTMQAIATQGWLREIDLWCGRMRKLASEHHYRYPKSLQDAIYLDNLSAGISALKERGGYRAAWRHFLASRYPFRSNPLSQLKLVAKLILPRRRRVSAQSAPGLRASGRP